MTNQEQYETICWKAEKYDKMKKIIRDIIDRMKEERKLRYKRKEYIICIGLSIAINIIWDELLTQLTDIDIPKKEE